MKDLSLEELAKESERYASPVSEKEKAILDAAEKLFGRDGYDVTPTAEIAREAGVTERTLFKYFPSKSVLLKRVLFPVLLHLVIPGQLRHMREIIKSAGGDIDTLMNAIMTDRLKFFDANKGRLKFMMQELLKDDELRERIATLWKKELYAEGLKLTKKYQQEGRIRKDLDADTVTRVMVTLVASYIVTRGVLRPQAKWDDKHETAQMLEIFLNGVRPR